MYIARKTSTSRTLRCPTTTSCALPVPESALSAMDSSHIRVVSSSIDGACSNNGKDGARSSIGVYHGEGNRQNEGRAPDDVERHTNQIAELKACIVALTDAIRIFSEQYENKKKMLDAVVIKSDSAYVVRGVAEWLPKWKANGWINSRGLPVANQELLKKIEDLIELLEKCYVIVKLWLVPREMNQKADRLAKLALENGTPETTYYDV